MTWLHRLFAGLCIATTLAACQAAGPTPLTLDARLEGPELVVNWGTSLPAGAELALSVWRAEDPEDDAFRIDRPLVLGADEQRVPIDVAGWPAGEVQAVLTFQPLAQSDPDVIAAVGTQGEKLSGPQLRTDPVDDERYLEASVSISIP